MLFPISQAAIAAYYAAIQQTQASQHANLYNQQAIGNYLSSTLQQGLIQAGSVIGRPPTRPVEKLSLEIGELIGWRAWRLAKNGLLQSLAHDNIWLPGEIMGHNDDGAKIKIEDHGSAGVYAFSDRGYALKDTEFASTPNLVFGSVRLWGTVVEHEHGYRAEFAAVHSIDAVNVGDGHWWKRKAETAAALTALREAYLSAPTFTLEDEAA